MVIIDEGLLVLDDVGVAYFGEHSDLVHAAVPFGEGHLGHLHLFQGVYLVVALAFNLEDFGEGA